MKRLVIIPLFLISIIAIISCSDINSPIKKIFSGITETGQDGPEPIGNIDTTDWLLRFDYNTNDSSLSRYTISVPPAFPNPTTRYTTLRYMLPTIDSIKIWLEDEFGNKSILKSEYVLAGVHNEKIDLLFDKEGNERNNGIYRIYFKVVTRPKVPLVKGDVELRK
jgi:hypothetical protein